jgi:glycosyltransferase involved in cell wall biosynthesis
VKILFLTFGPSIIPSSRTRVYQYLHFFDKDNYVYKIINNFNDNPYVLKNKDRYFKDKYKYFAILLPALVVIFNALNVIHSIVQITRSVFLTIFFGYNILFIQKVFVPIFILRVLRRCNKTLVFDFDDAIYLQNGWFRNKKRFDRMMPYFDLIILENDSAQSYINDLCDVDVLKIIGPIDTNRYYPLETNKSCKVVIGWIGSPSTQKYLSSISDVFFDICDKYNDVVFETIGAGKLEIDGLSVVQREWNYNNEIESLNNFDIGIMPLVDDEWSRGKGGYKLLQYMSIGIPCCASPVGVNNKLIIDGINGYLLNTNKDWLNALSMLIENRKMRKEIGLNGRKMAIEQFSFDHYYPILKKSLLNAHQAKLK